MAKKADNEKKDATAQEDGAEALTLRSYPGAMASVRRIRARAGLGAFALVVLLSLHSGLTLPSATARGLVAGVTVQLAAWKIAVIVWRQLILAQVRAVEEARLERRRQRVQAAAERRAQTARPA
jgi:hypothetical protein